MFKSKHLLFVLLATVIFSCKDKDTTGPNDVEPVTNEMYFPPAAHGTWTATSPDDLQWDSDKLADLKEYIKSKNTKGFIILKDGRIVVEEYFNGHTINANGPWYSAAKSLTSTMVGIAADDGDLALTDKSSQYLGEGWSSLTSEQEDSITVWHHLTMSTGLKSQIGNFNAWTCTEPSCFTYDKPAGTQWAYHQGAFTKTQDIISDAVGINYNQYCKQQIQDKIGMNGVWSNLLYVRIFSSTTRSMARFGLLALNKGIWDGDTIYSENYYNQMITTSQDMNKAYGLLWWLNGKADFRGTLGQNLYSGSLIPNGPSDMFCALGAQDQKIYVVPSENIVVVRMGDPAGNTEFASSSFDNELWGKLQEIF